MPEQLVIDGRMMEQVCDFYIAVTEVEVIHGGHLLISIKPPIVIVPGKPMLAKPVIKKNAAKAGVCS